MTENSMRETYGMGLPEMEFKDTETNGGLEKVDDSIEAIKENPINWIVSSFGKQYLENERVSKLFLIQLQNDLDEFEKELSSNPRYNEMDIVKLVKNILTKYFNWATSQRQTIFLSYSKMKEALDVVHKYYITKEVYDLERESLEAAFKDNMPGQSGQVVEVNGIKMIKIPFNFQDTFNEGDMVIIHKVNIAI